MKLHLEILISLPLGLLCVACESGVSLVEPAEITHEPSVKPGINDSFLAEDLKVEEFVERFEGESREVYVHRQAIVDAIGLEVGDVVADVGAGTGAFLSAFADAVGHELAGGRVIALDIAPKFVEHLEQRAAQEGLLQVEARLCGERSVGLPKKSIDVAFLCDVYHHFEYPRSTMASIHSALRRNGEVVIVDFDRIPGVSREWTLGHVRASREEVYAELESFDFEFVEEFDIPGLEENYAARFRRK